MKPVRPTSAFTLIEVLIGLGLLIIALGIILNNVARDTLSISRSQARYQSLLRCSSQLERKMERESGQANKGTEVLNTVDPGKERKENAEAVKVETAVKVVTADPRVEQVEVTSSYANNLKLSLSAYRLRVRRQQNPRNASPSNSGPNGSNAGSGNTGATNPAGNNPPASSNPPATSGSAGSNR